MKLYTWPTSPFGAKVWAVAIAAGLDDSITKVLYHPWQTDPELSKLNPLNKIPVLITQENETLYDSPVICEYLIEQSGKKELLENKWCNLRWQALADGIMDAGVLVRYETYFRPGHLQCKDWLNRQLSAIHRGLDILSQEKRIVCKELVKYVRDRWNLSCDEETIRKVLKSMKLSWQKPCKSNYKANPMAQKVF